MVARTTKGYSLVELEQTVHLKFTPTEARYLRELVGMVKFSDLPHGKFANDLYETLYELYPEVLEEPPYVVSMRGIAAADTDWREL